MKEIVFITGNEYKFEQAKAALKDTGIILTHQKLETPEIQSTNIEEVASYSASWAANKLNKAVVVTDVGYYFQGLKGFPGPFIKYINQWFSAEDYLRLMEGKTDRTVIVRQCLSYCEPNNQPVNFIGEVTGSISNKAGSVGIWKTSINQIFIPEGFDRVVGEMEMDEAVSFWNKDTIWSQFVNYINVKVE